MKKIVLSFLMLLGIGSLVNAQVTFSPAVFTAQDVVTLTVDVTGTPMAGQAEAFIWIFSNTTGGVARDGFTNTAWTNSPASAKMTAAGTNRWSFTFTGTTMFSQTPGELRDFGFLVKAKDGSRQTADYKPFRFDPLIFTPTTFRAFPAKVGQDDVINLNFDQKLATDITDQRMTVTGATVTAFDQTGAQIGTAAVTLTARSLGDRVWQASILPTRSFTVTAPNRIARIRYRFTGTSFNASGGVINVQTGETELELTIMK